MEELAVPCPGCDRPLLVPVGAETVACRECGEQLRVTQNATTIGLSRGEAPASAYTGAVRYIVMRGNPEAYRAWQQRASNLDAEYSRYRWRRIRAYVACAAVLLLGFTFTGVTAAVNQTASGSIWRGAPGVGLVATLLLFLLGAAIGSHYQRLEERAKELRDAWSLNEPLMARDTHAND